MATISKIEGSHSQLSGQVTQTARPQPEMSPQKTERKVHAHQQELPDQEKIQTVLEQLRATINEHSAETHEVSFRQDPDSSKVIIEIRNPQGELLKQFPPEKVLNLHEKLDELSGIVIDRMT